MKHVITLTDQSEDDSHSLPILPAILVPACAVLLLLTVGAAIAILYVRKRRQRVAVNSMNKVEMKSPNRVDTETGLGRNTNEALAYYITHMK